MTESKAELELPCPVSGNGNRSFSLLKLSVLATVVVAVVIYRLDSFDPAELPGNELTRRVEMARECNGRMKEGEERVGEGELLKPEDIAYDSELGLIYTGCEDGWVKRVRVNDSVVDNWVNTGGRPLGLALGPDGELIVADTEKGLLKVSNGGAVEPLTHEADGVKFKLTDGVDVSHNGVIYFTDASFKHGFHEYIFDILEGKPHGRFMSFDPTTKTTTVLVPDLFFANGVSVSPSQDFVIFCETPLRRCRKYHIAGERKGSVERFVEDLPGFPDNIRYDGDGHYWIAMSTEMSSAWYVILKYPTLRKILAMMEKYIGRLKMEKNGGVVAVDLEGKLIGHYYDEKLSLVTTGIKIGNYLYCGSLVAPYITRLNLDEYPARAAGCRRSNSEL